MKKVLMLASFAFFGFTAANAQNAEVAQQVNPNAPDIKFT